MDQQLTTSMKKLLLFLVLATAGFISCTEKEETEQSDNIAELIVGKWMTKEIDGNALATNEKFVYTFESATSGYISASLSDYTNSRPKWTNHSPSHVTVDGNKIILDGYLDKTTSFEAELEVKSISRTEMLTESKYTVYHNSDVVSVNSGTVLWTKVMSDYSYSIIGMWEGQATGDEGSEFDDGELHRWEYNSDNSYIYYSLDDESEWTATSNGMSLYFVDGTLLCTRWKNVGEEETEHREWWEIANIADGDMNWTALRRRDDGTTYTATFSMTKVQ